MSRNEKRAVTLQATNITLSIMKRFAFALIALLAVAVGSLTICADDGKQDPPNILLQKLKPIKPRPGMPSAVFIDVYLADNSLLLSLPETAEWCTVEIQNNGETVLADILTHEDPAIDVSHLHGTYGITCRTDGNQVFGGEITLP